MTELAPALPARGEEDAVHEGALLPLNHLADPRCPAAAVLPAAMLASTDALAITAVLRKAGGPEWLVTLLEGEALLNDASGQWGGGTGCTAYGCGGASSGEGCPAGCPQSKRHHRRHCAV